MSAQHTPGPWIAGDDEDSDFFLVGPEEFPGLVTRPVVQLHDEANARLIAAAPELLEALQLIEQWDAEGLALCEHHIVRARAAIAKATKGQA